MIVLRELLSVDCNSAPDTLGTMPVAAGKKIHVHPPPHSAATKGMEGLYFVSSGD